MTDLRVVDADTHVIEPADLWTARMPKKWHEMAPHVIWDEDRGDEAWYIGDERVLGAGSAAMAGFDGYAPDEYPRRLEDVPLALREAPERLALMDEYGIESQILYPNIALFNSQRIMNFESREFQNAIARVYNEWQTEWASADPDRLHPMTSLPFWDLEASITEMQRSFEAGHKGVIFTQAPETFGLPTLNNPHWDPLWAAAQELGQSINFHVGTGESPIPQLENFGDPTMGDRLKYIGATVNFSQTNARTIALLICGGVCQRFPRLNFVMVESGVGWIPYITGYLDWQWHNGGVLRDDPSLELLPSEYFARQIYACFWFEVQTTKDAIDVIGPDNFLFETDFPHPTSLSPGPASTAVKPSEHITQGFSDLEPEVLEKIMGGNAARVYNL